MTRTQKAAIKEYLRSNGLDVAFRAKPPTAREFTTRNRAEFGDSTQWTAADFETVQNLAMPRPSLLQRCGYWLRSHTIAPLNRWQQAIAKDPVATALFLFGIALPGVLLALSVTGLVLHLA
ncbi:hypothetical protein [Streptomyces sp. NPDC018059]|uniref:hypothetical protein n=1 Tax=Streptomyces sp. NPDC018059 TaxID=3365041 RepID=UPI0037893181